MKFDQFTINTGRNYQKHQTGIVAAVAEARRKAAQHNEMFTVYADWTGYGYCSKPTDRHLTKHDEITAREICFIRPDGSMAHINRATVASTEDFIAAQIARIDVEQQVSPAAQALAASWIR